MPAKYRDPRTGLPYATKEAFKIIREDKSKSISEKKNMELLSDSVPGQGFPIKQKRTMVPRRETSCFRPFARFRKFPAVEIVEDSE